MLAAIKAASTKPTKVGHAWRALLIACASALLIALGALRADAHAVLVDSTPPNGAVLDVAPEIATLTFSEEVQVAPGAVRLFDESQKPVALHARALGSTLEIELPGELQRGNYAVAWRIISADSHPVSGVLPFSVGQNAGNTLEVQEDSEAAIGLQRFLKATHLIGLLLLSGLTIFFTASAGPEQVRSASLRRVLFLSAASAVASAALLVPVTAMAVLGRPLSTLLVPHEWASALSAGTLAVLALTGIGTVGLMIFQPQSRPPALRSIRSRWLVCLPLLTLFPAPALTGHTMLFRPRPLLIAADVVHVTAAAVWLGGAVGVLMLLTHRASEIDVAVRSVERFSAHAAWAVGGLTITGTLFAVIAIPAWSGLITTNYGRALLTKTGLVVITLGLAWWNRNKLLPYLRSHPTTRKWSALRRIVAYEAALIVLAVSVTAGLGTFDPNQRGHDHAGSMSMSNSVSVEGEKFELHAQLDETELVFDVVDSDGKPLELLEDPTIKMRLPAADLGPLLIETEFLSAGKFRAQLDAPVAGVWEVDIPLRLEKFAAPVANLEFQLSPKSSSARFDAQGA